MELLFIQLSDSELNRTSPGQKEAKIFLLNSVHVSWGSGAKSTAIVTMQAITTFEYIIT